MPKRTGREEGASAPDNNMGKNYTKEQELFYVGKSLLSDYERISMERPLEPFELERIDHVKEQLFGSIVKFGMKTASGMLSKYRLDSDAYMDVQQAQAVIFFEKLPDYDPLKSTPTTYFVRYFKQVISEYLRENTLHLSQYDAKNVAKVKRAIAYYESHGIMWDEAMLSNRTGLSAKVLRNTLYIATNAKRASMDDEEKTVNLKSNDITPEEMVLKQEILKELVQVLRQTLTNDEFTFFLVRTNLLGEAELTYQEMADKYGIPLRDVKQMLSSIIGKLNNNPVIRAMAKEQKYDVTNVPVHLQDDGTEMIEKGILEALNLEEFSDSRQEDGPEGQNPHNSENKK